MAGAPDDESKRAVRDTDREASRVRRLAWVSYAVFAALLVLLALGLAALASWSSYSARVDVATANAASPDPPPPTSKRDPFGDRQALPPSVRDYLDRTPYPPSSGRLTEAQSDLLSPNQRFEDFRPIPETYSTNPDEIVSVKLTSDRYFYTGDAPVRLTLALRRGSETIRPLSLDLAATREGRAGSEGNAVPLRLQPDGEDWAGELDTARFADHHGPIRVDARIEYAPGLFHDESLRLFLTPEGKIPARFTGEVDDQILNGSLRIDIGIDVEQSGDYRIDANLYDARGVPVAFSAYKGPLRRGQKSVPIEFFGRLLIDVGRPGPYAVGEIRGYRFLDGQYPDRERIPDLAGRYPTKDFGLSALSPEEYVSEDKLRMVRLLMEDVENGIAIDAPPIAGAAAIPGPDAL